MQDREPICDLAVTRPFMKAKRSCVWFLFAMTAGGFLSAQDGKPSSAMGTRERVETYMSHIADQKMAHCSIQYGVPEWTAEQDEALRNSKGQRLPFGGGSWARLETNVPMTIGGRDVAPGLYCLALEHAADGSWSLVLYEDQEVREKNLTPWGSRQVEGMGSTYSLNRDWVKEKKEVFTVTFVPGTEEVEATLQVHWSNQLLSVPVAWDLSKAPRVPWSSGGR